MPMSLAVSHTITIQQILPGIKSKSSTSQKNETDSQAVFGHLSHKMGNIWNTNHPIQDTYSELATVPDTFHNFLNLHNGPRGKKWLHMAEEDIEAQPGKWMPRVPLDKCLDTARIHLSGSKSLLSYTDRLRLDCEPWGYRTTFSVSDLKTAHEPTVLSTDYLKGTRENVKLIGIITGWNSYLID